MKYLLSLALVAITTTTLLASDPPSANMDWVKYTVPGEGHKILDSTVGKFTYTSKFWMAANTTPETSKGTSESKWILDGRYVEQEVTGTAMGKPFHGKGVTGFDSFKQEYQSTWMDTMSTAIMLVTGTKQGDTIKQSGTGSDPMTGTKDKWFRTELNIKSKNEHTFAMWSKDEKGQEFKTMEMDYKRKK